MDYPRAFAALSTAVVQAFFKPVRKLLENTPISDEAFDAAGAILAWVLGAIGVWLSGANAFATIVPGMSVLAGRICSAVISGLGASGLSAIFDIGAITRDIRISERTIAQTREIEALRSLDLENDAG